MASLKYEPKDVLPRNTPLGTTVLIGHYYPSGFPPQVRSKYGQTAILEKIFFSGWNNTERVILRHDGYSEEYANCGLTIVETPEEESFY